MNATGITQSLAEKIAEEHQNIKDIADLGNGEDGATRTVATMGGTFEPDDDTEKVFFRKVTLSHADADAVLALLHDRATARLAALQDEARKALGVADDHADSMDVSLGKKVVSDYYVAIAESKSHEEAVDYVTGRIFHIKLSNVYSLKRAEVIELLKYAGIPELIPSPLSGDFLSEADERAKVEAAP